MHSFSEMKSAVFEVVKSAGPDGIRPADIIRRFQSRFPSADLPHVRTVTRWVREDPRIYRPSGHGYYAVRPEHRGVNHSA